MKFKKLALVLVPFMLAGCGNPSTPNTPGTDSGKTEKYTITLELDGGTLSSTSIEVGASEEYVLPSPTKEGYTFLGWFDEENNQVSSVDDFGFSSDKTFAARWSKNPEWTTDNKGYFGMYPQDRVTLEGLIAKLNEAAGEKPDIGTESLGDWHSYNIYSNSEVKHGMWYQDIEFKDGNKYRGVYLGTYRPFYTSMGGSETYSNNSNQKNNGYETGAVYWFKYSPIEWNLLQDTAEGKLLHTSKVLDAQQFSHLNTKENEAVSTTDNKVWANNYYYSDFRSYVNGSFYNSAFSSEDKEHIQTTTQQTATLTNGSNVFQCDDTQDKVFALTYQDINNTSLFPNGSDSRKKCSTDYAKCVGVKVKSRLDDSTGYWLRTPDFEFPSNTCTVRTVDDSGYGSSSVVTSLNTGVAPAIVIK